MTALPTTLAGIITLVVLVLPGVIYASVRTRLCGFRSTDREIGSQIIRAIAFGFVADAVYLTLFGNHLLRWLELKPSGVPLQPRQLGLALLTLGVIVPALVAALQFGRIELVQRRIFGRSVKIPWTTSTYDSTPTAWDLVVPTRGGRWIRVRLADDRWVGGWYADESCFSTYPEDPEIFIEKQYFLDETGTFLREVQHSAGVWVPLKAATAVEWIDPDYSEEEQGNG